MPCECQLKSRSHNTSRALTTFKLDGEVTSLSESSQGEVGDNREKWGDNREKLIAI
jgi:hypothetical protein